MFRKEIGILEIHENVWTKKAYTKDLYKKVGNKNKLKFGILFENLQYILALSD